MKRLGLTALVLLPLRLAAQQFPASPPPAALLGPVRFPRFQEAVLPNGLRLVLVESHRQPVVSLRLAIPAGRTYDPPGKEGLADFVAGLLTKGAGDRDADAIAATIERVGGSLSAGAGQDFLTIQADVLAADAPLAFGLLADVAMRPTFSLAELELLRQQTLSGLQAELAQPSALASRIFALTLYGDHPYGRQPTPGTIQSISRGDVTAFAQARLRPDGALLVIAGDLSLTGARALAAKALGDWHGAAPAAPVFPAPPVRSSTEIVLLHLPGSVQSNIRVGNLTFGPADSNLYAALLANRVLGDGTDSRLFRILRERKGWSYGAYSFLSRPRGVGAFQANVDVRTEATDSALIELLAQLRRIGTDLVPAAEIDAARSAIVGSFPLTIQTATQVASAVAEVKLLGLPTNYLETYRARVAAVTPARLRAAARATIRPTAAVIVVVGDAAVLYDRLKGIAPIRLIGPDGRTLTVADLQPRAGGLDLDLDRLVPRQDSLTVMVQGKPLGFQRATLERTADGFRYVEQTEITGFVKQTTEVGLDSSGAPRSVSQSGTLQGQETRIDITYAGTHVTGSARAASPQGAKSFAIDTTLEAGTLDDNSIQALLPALRLSPGAHWTLRVFASGENRVREMSLTVAGVDSVTTAAGPVETYRTDLAGGNQSVSFYLTTALPHRLMKVHIGGAPIEFIAPN